MNIKLFAILIITILVCVACGKKKFEGEANRLRIYEIISEEDQIIYQAKDRNSKILATIPKGERFESDSLVSGFYHVYVDNQFGLPAGYVPKGNLTMGFKGHRYFDYTPPVVKKPKAPGYERDQFNPRNIYDYFIFIAFALILFSVMPSSGSILPLILNISIGLLLYCYVRRADCPLWMCIPDNVGWIFAIINFIVFVVLMLYIVSCIQSSFIFGLQILSFNIFALVGFFMAYIYFRVLINFALEVFYDLPWAILLALMMMPSYRTFIGTFTDSSGRAWDVFLIE